MTPIDILLEGERRGILTPYHAELLREARRRNMAPGPLRATEEERAMSAGDYGTGIAAAAKRGLAALGEGLQFAGRAAPVVGGVASLLGIAPAIKESSEAVEKESRENLPKGLIERERERQRLAAAAGAKSGEYSRILPEAGAYIKQTATDPALLLGFLAEQAPALGVQAGIAQLVKRGATARGVREGMSREAAEQAAIKPATTAALASGVGLQTASVGSETEQEAYNIEHGITPESIKRDIHNIVADTASRDNVLVEIEDDSRNNLVGHNLRSYIEELEGRMRAAAADLEFEEAGRLRDEIRRLEADELGIPDGEKRAPIVGRSNEGKPGTRKGRFGRQGKTKWGR